MRLGLDLSRLMEKPKGLERQKQTERLMEKRWQMRTGRLMDSPCSQCIATTYSR